MVLAIAALTGAVWAVHCRLESAKPYQIEDEFLALLEQRDWSRIYDISLREQFDKSGMQKQQFVTMMKTASEGLPDAYFQGVTFEEMGPKEQDYTRGTHVALLTFVNGPIVEGEPVKQAMHVLRSSQGWHVALNEFPFRLARLHGEDVANRWRRIAAAMESAGVEEYWMDIDGPVVSASRIRRYLADEIPVEQVYEVAPRS